MKGKNRLIVYLFFIVVIILMTSNVYAHEEDEEESGISSIFVRIHWYILILTMLTCYYFRGFSERLIVGKPRSCSAGNEKNYKGDRIVYRFHRIFFWLALPSVIIYLSYNAVILPQLLSTNLGLLQLVTKALEFLVGFTFLFYLLGCHHLRFLFGVMADNSCSGCWKLRLYNKQSVLNRSHDYWFWISVIGIIALHVFFVFGGHVG